MATVVVRHGLDDRRDEQLVVMVVENCRLAEFGPMEKAEALGVLREGGLALTEIARRTDLSASRVGARSPCSPCSSSMPHPANACAPD